MITAASYKSASKISNLQLFGRSALLAGILFCTLIPAHADAISPAINGDGKVYSREKANSDFFGNGISGRLTEASTLRFEGEQLTADGRLDEAIKKLQKAVQLDATDPTGHVLYARALSAKVRSSKTPDEACLAHAIEEWKLIWHHDADLLEQVEGRREAQSLRRVQKALERGKQIRPNLLEQVASKKSSDSL